MAFAWFNFSNQPKTSGVAGVSEEGIPQEQQWGEIKKKTAFSRAVQDKMDTPWRWPIGRALKARLIFDAFRMCVEALLMIAFRKEREKRLKGCGKLPLCSFAATFQLQLQ